MKKRLMIVDGSSLLYRAFYAMPPLSDSRGNPTNAVYGFLNMLLKLYEELNPQYITVAFDKDKHTFRNDLYADYKATRKPAPDELRPQFALIREVLARLGIRVLEIEGYEGDDIIGTVAKNIPDADTDISVITGDRDALQLVDDRITVYLTKKGISTMLAVTPAVMRSEYGYTPSQVIDMKALMGDASDNIPGVSGVGEKTAQKLIAEYGTVEGVYDHIDNINGKKLREKLIDSKDKAMLSKELATINCRVPLSFTADMFLPQPREEEVKEIFKRLGFRSLLKRFAAFARFENPEKEEDAAELTFLEDFTPQALDGAVAAVAAVYEKLPGAMRAKSLAVAVENGVYYVSGEAVGVWLRALAKADTVFSEDGKSLYKAAKYAGAATPPLFDVTLAAYLLDPTRTTYGLTYLSELFGLPFREDKRDEAHQLGSCAAFILSLRTAEMEALEDKRLADLYRRIEAPLVRTLAVMEDNGFAVNRDRLEAMKAEFSREADALETEIYDLAGTSFNINSTKQLGVILFEKMGLPALKKTKTGYSTDSSVLEELSEYNKIIPKILKFRALKKLISTYLDGLEPLIVQETGRIYTSFNQMVTATGRLSSSEPNLQNIPVRTEQGRKIRSFFVPGKGYDWLISGDYSQIELRLLAHLSQDPTMIDGFRHRQDIHRRTAAEVFGVPFDDVSGELRSHAKAVNFGIIYGISDFGLARNLGITRKRAKEYIESYFARYSTIHAYMNGLVEEARRTGEARTMFGRLRVLPEINSKNFMRRSFAERTAMNTPIQGSAADIIKMAMNAVQAELEARNLKSRMLVQVHDELVLEVPDSEKKEAETVLKETMEGIVTLSVPLIADIHSGKTWEEAK